MPTYAHIFLLFFLKKPHGRSSLSRMLYNIERCFMCITASTSTMENLPQSNAEGKSQLLDALMQTSAMEQDYVQDAVLQAGVMEPDHLQDALIQTGGLKPCHPQDLLIQTGVTKLSHPQNAGIQTCLMDPGHLQDVVIQTGVMESCHPQDTLEHHQDTNTMLPFSAYDMLDLSTLINDSLDSWPDAFLPNGTQDTFPHTDGIEPNDLEDLEALLFNSEY